MRERWPRREIRRSVAVRLSVDPGNGHQTNNILNKLPESQQRKAKRMLRDVWGPKRGKTPKRLLDAFGETYSVTYKKAAECLEEGPGPIAKVGWRAKEVSLPGPC